MGEVHLKGLVGPLINWDGRYTSLKRENLGKNVCQLHRLAEVLQDGVGQPMVLLNILT